MPRDLATSHYVLCRAGVPSLKAQGRTISETTSQFQGTGGKEKGEMDRGVWGGRGRERDREGRERRVERIKGERKRDIV